MKRVQFEPAFILHRRPYREHSFLVELFSENYGRITAVAKGVRQNKKVSIGLLQAFTPLILSWVGRGELMTLTHYETDTPFSSLQGECLYAGFYLNELLMRLFQKFDPHPRLFKRYALLIKELQNTVLKNHLLRSFEKCLLEELGYGPLPKNREKEAFQMDRYYCFIAEEGFQLMELSNNNEKTPYVFLGKNLIAIANEEWVDESVLHDAKRLTRIILSPLLGERPIYSRFLFNSSQQEKKHAH